MAEQIAHAASAFQSQQGAAEVQEVHGKFFRNAGDTLQQEIKRITRMDVRGATAVVQAFANGTIVQVFLLSGKVPSGSFDAERSNEQQ